jgi:hypothetical protein
MFSPRTSESTCWPSESIYIKKDNQNLPSNETNKKTTPVLQGGGRVNRAIYDSFSCLAR